MKTLVLSVIIPVLCLGVNGNYDNNDIAEMKAKMDAMERRLAAVEQQQGKRLKWSHWFGFSRNTQIFVLLKIENLGRHSCWSHIFWIWFKVPCQCEFAPKIQLVTIINLFPFEVVQNDNIANFVYYGKTRMIRVFDEPDKIDNIAIRLLT